MNTQTVKKRKRSRKNRKKWTVMQNLAKEFHSLAEADAWVAGCEADGHGWMRWGVWRRAEGDYLAIVQRVKLDLVAPGAQPKMARFETEADAVAWVTRMKRSGYSQMKMTHDGNLYLVIMST